MTSWPRSGSSDGLPRSGAQSSVAFHLLDERVQRWVWEQGWDELRDIQEAATRSVLEQSSDLIIASATATGKTEAAFLPICSTLVAGEKRPGIRALYVSPLKALINDQFRRMEDLCKNLQVPVHRWHGDVPSSHKRRLVERPDGVLLITPESLEALFVGHGQRMRKLFQGLEWVVVDELHAFVGSDRGRQLQSLLHRLELCLGHRVRRVGLSATLGDMSLGAAFLRPGGKDQVETIESTASGQEIRLQIRGYLSRQDTVGSALDPTPEAATPSDVTRIADHLFSTLRGADNLVFANSRRTVEEYADLLRRRSEAERLPNEFFPHHGNLSRELREDLEKKLKDPAEPATAICTSTLELGIDIGQVSSIGQIGAPFSVSSLRQRLGRSGRRGEPATLRFYISESEITPRSHPLDRLRGELVQAVAMVELLIERWCEPPTEGSLHLSPLVQQVLSLIAERGGIRAQEGWRALSGSGPFRSIDSPCFVSLLRCMGAQDLLVQSRDGTLLFGEKGERIANHFSFYTIFPTADEFQVLHRGRPLGTLSVDYLLAEGLHIIFAGRRWRVLSVETEEKVVVVEASPGGRLPRFEGGFGGLIHDRVRAKMREVWEGHALPRYLDPEARRLLEEGRAHYGRLGLETSSLVRSGKGTIFFLCRGDTITNTVALQLLARGLEVAVEGSAILIDEATPADLRSVLVELAREGAMNPAELAAQVGNKRAGKYDWVLEERLLTADYASRAIDTEGAQHALQEEVGKLDGQPSPAAMSSRVATAPPPVPMSDGQAMGTRLPVRLTATALAGHLACRHLTASNLAAARGEIESPPWGSPVLAAIRERGLEHEARYLEHLRATGVELHELDHNGDLEAGAARTVEAMLAGASAIVQATLSAGDWFGIADVLLRVEEPSELGPWSYEVIDTKLARETSSGTILQLCLYSELVGAIQGSLPRQMHVVSPGREFRPRSYRALDYLAYYRWTKRRLEDFVLAWHDGNGGSTYPDPTAHCEVCRWRPVCNERRREDDHLCLVAGASKLQIKELQAHGIKRLESLARMPLPLEWRPSRGSGESYERLREQARVQLLAREEKRPVYELLPRKPERGLARLPPPSSGDVFFDIEGDPFAGEGGREYLFGYVASHSGREAEYHSHWALRAVEERALFQQFVTDMMQRWAADPDFHIYHYAAYEPSALKRLMGRYAVCEDEIDRMLRAGVFVDLYSIVRQSVLAGVESYSIKQLEPLFDFEREENLLEVRAHLSAVERAIELNETAVLPGEVLRVVEGYNRDDCYATLRLRNWLEERRSERVAAGEVIPRPVLEPEDPGETLKDWQLEIQLLADTLLRDLPEDREVWHEEHHARWKLAHLLEWHWREEKVTYWEYYRLVEMGSEELVDEKVGVGGLRFEGIVGGTSDCPIHEYSFPHQEVSLEEGDSLYEGDVKVGTLDALTQAERRLLIKRTKKSADFHPQAVFAHDVISTKTLAGALFRLGQWVAEHGPDAAGEYRAARDLLLAVPPRLKDGLSGLVRHPGESTLGLARRLALELDHGTLPVQGPPGSGKTYSGARMICALVEAGKKVGITANSHKVIRNLLDEVVEAARQASLALGCVQKVRRRSESETSGITEALKSSEVLAALEEGGSQVAGGTAWLWARKELFESVDVLVVDEAGQMSLANTLAVAQAGKALVLLGDPQQLEQPQKGSHPEGTDVSALEHLLGGSDTVAEGRGLFLPKTWRLHPSLCAFNSEVFYDGRLTSRPELARQQIERTEPFAASGFWFVPAEHEGNQSSSPEEVELVAQIVEQLTAQGSTWTTAKGRKLPLGISKILIIAPYNAQVALLSEELGPHAQIGTVDKFQGQEAPVVIYSMATSTPEEAPRGMDFLYSPNRLNVATSRARCAFIMVASRRLFEPECRTPHQMKLANAFCRFLEVANGVPMGSRS